MLTKHTTSIMPFDAQYYSESTHCNNAILGNSIFTNKSSVNSLNIIEHKRLLLDEILHVWGEDMHMTTSNTLNTSGSIGSSHNCDGSINLNSTRLHSTCEFGTRPSSTNYRTNVGGNLAECCGHSSTRSRLSNAFMESWYICTQPPPLNSLWLIRPTSPCLVINPFESFNSRPPEFVMKPIQEYLSLPVIAQDYDHIQPKGIFFGVNPQCEQGTGVCVCLVFRLCFNLWMLIFDIVYGV